MADNTLYELLGISKERAEEIARAVRKAFSEARCADDWVKRLVDELGITQENAEIFACGWFAGRYAGVSEVFNVVQREMDRWRRIGQKRQRKRRKIADTSQTAMYKALIAMHLTAMHKTGRVSPTFISEGADFSA